MFGICWTLYKNNDNNLKEPSIVKGRGLPVFTKERAFELVKRYNALYKNSEVTCDNEENKNDMFGTVKKFSTYLYGDRMNIVHEVYEEKK